MVGVGLSLLYFLQEKLIYVPRIPGVSNDIVYLPKDFGFSYEVLKQYVSTLMFTCRLRMCCYAASCPPSSSASTPLVQAALPLLRRTSG